MLETSGVRLHSFTVYCFYSLIMEIFLLLHQLHLLKIWQLKLADGHVVTTVVTDLYGILLHVSPNL